MIHHSYAFPTLKDHEHFTPCHKQHGAMEPNTKLLFEDLMKQMMSMREEMKAGFTAQEATVTKRFTEMEQVVQQCDEHVAALEASMAALDQSFAVSKPEVESSFSLVKLNAFFNREAKAAGNPQSGVLSTRSATARSLAGSPADGPSGHHVGTNHRDHGFERVFTQIHDPVTGTMTQSHPSLNFSNCAEPNSAMDTFKFSNTCSADSRLNLGQLPKLHFPKFDGDHPKLWQSRCENYFEMYSVDTCVAGCGR
jgi:hypothetical protein